MLSSTLHKLASNVVVCAQKDNSTTAKTGRAARVLVHESLLPFSIDVRVSQYGLSLHS